MVAYLCPGEALASLDLLRDDLSVWKVEREKTDWLLVLAVNICELVLVPVDSPRIRVVSELLWTVRRS